MAIDRIPGVGPQNSDIAAAVAAPSAATIAAAVAAPSAATIAAAVAAPSAATIATQVAASVPTLAQITSTVQANAGSPFGGTWTNLGFVATSNQASVSFSNLSGYKYLRFYLHYTAPAGSGTNICLRMNSDSTANNYLISAILESTNDIGALASVGIDRIRISGGSNSNSMFTSYIEIDNSNASVWKTVRFLTNYINTSGFTVHTKNGTGIHKSTSAISSITFFPESGNFMDAVSNYGTPGNGAGIIGWGAN